MLTDLAMTEKGDLIVGANGDLLLRRGNECLADQILFRLKTIRGDYLLEPGCGASLENFVGQPNTERTGAALELAARHALTHDGFLLASDLSVRCVPLSETEVALLLDVFGEDEPFRLAAALDLRAGEIRLEVFPAA